MVRRNKTYFNRQLSEVNSFCCEAQKNRKYLKKSRLMIEDRKFSPVVRRGCATDSSANAAFGTHVKLLAPSRCPCQPAL
jgi:hypothetical protein